MYINGQANDDDINSTEQKLRVIKKYWSAWNVNFKYLLLQRNIIKERYLLLCMIPHLS